MKAVINDAELFAKRLERAIQILECARSSDDSKTSREAVEDVVGVLYCLMDQVDTEYDMTPQQAVHAVVEAPDADKGELWK